MKKVIRLVGVQLWALLGDMLAIGNNKKNKKTKALYTGVIFFILLMSGISFFYTFMLGIGLKKFGCADILPSIMMAITCITLFFTSMFKVKGTLFGFKDYDTVMSLPISTSGVVISRLIILYLINSLFVIIIIVPMMIAYGIIMMPSPLFYIYGVIALVFIPFIPIAIASILGTVIAYIASKFQHNNLLGIILTMGLLALFIAFPATLSNRNEQQLVDMSKAVSAQVKSLYPLADLYSKAVVEYDLIALFLFVAISIIAFLFYTIIVKAVFKKINTTIMTGSYHKKFKLGEIKTASPLKALYQKELKRYFASSIYVMNTAFAVVMLTMGTVALFFVDFSKLADAQIPANAVTIAAPVFLFFCIGMCCITASSISLEGKNLWIMKSLPVEPKTVYMSKVAVNLTILAPCLIDAFLLGVALKLSVLHSLLLVLMAAAFSVGISFYGLLINLRLPKFDWSNETIIVKQSAACMIAIFSGMLFCVVPYILMVLVPSELIAYSVITLLIVIIDVALYMILKKYGNKRFAQLGN